MGRALTHRGRGLLAGRRLIAEDLGPKALEFAQELTDTLTKTLGYGCSVVAESHGERFVVQPADDQAIPLRIDGVPHAGLSFNFHCELDHIERYLRVEQSQFFLRWGNTKDPLLRLHFQRSPQSKPTCHWHVHAERGAFSALLAAGSARNPHTLAGLHLPVGGARFRPCLEDFLELLIEEVGIDHAEHGREAIREGRERWRRIQLAAMVRDAPEQAVATLREMGYEVGSPETTELRPTSRHLRES